ncbi:GNAT family N-acetyltransferase [Oculatella sp. FACHB-28]|uniref:GNAT family N-acetyltransferase n=1 Tax=Oculatella sp. FACHB-28 TaxID=2692845 RepID=UPI001683DCDB|nr:GNAT family N-acetyltransferase [Cyanobacteria bacterium FACHB-471]MBD2055487.1 GNAT family N-acetyltransferase [Oculatella sp. FACHB-28]
MSIEFATADADIAKCFPVVVQLRPHLTETAFVEQVKRQQENGYHLVYLEENGVKAIAGFRILEMLANGRFLYVDDLVSDDSERSKGHGKSLLNWLTDYARSQNCISLQLDSGTHRVRAHRFYFRQGMAITSFHFSLKLND